MSEIQGYGKNTQAMGAPSFTGQPRSNAARKTTKSNDEFVRTARKVKSAKKYKFKPQVLIKNVAKMLAGVAIAVGISKTAGGIDTNAENKANARALEELNNQTKVVQQVNENDKGLQGEISKIVSKTEDAVHWVSGKTLSRGGEVSRGKQTATVDYIASLLEKNPELNKIYKNADDASINGDLLKVLNGKSDLNWNGLKSSSQYDFDALAKSPDLKDYLLYKRSEHMGQVFEKLNNTLNASAFGILSEFCNEKGKDRTISPLLASCVLYQESRGKINEKSNKGASGLMQIMPDTAKDLNNRFFKDAPLDVNKPVDNVKMGVQFLDNLYKRYDGDVVKMLAGYNAGPTNVAKYNGIPPFQETKDYCKLISEHFKFLEKYPEVAQKVLKAVR